MKSIPDKLLINLKILSKIEKNGRISRSYDGIIALEHSFFYSSIKRFINQDSRKQSINEIDSIIEEVESKTKSLLNSKFLLGQELDLTEYIQICEILSLLQKELRGAKLGIENLKFTYQSDMNTVSQLDIIILKVRSILRELDFKLPNYIKSIPFDMSSSIFPSIESNEKSDQVE